MTRLAFVVGTPKLSPTPTTYPYLLSTSVLFSFQLFAFRFRLDVYYSRIRLQFDCDTRGSGLDLLWCKAICS